MCWSGTIRLEAFSSRLSPRERDETSTDLCRVASVSTKSGLDVPIEPNVDREEELQALRAAEPVLWYDTEFDREQEIVGMNKEMTSIKDFDVYEEKLITALPINFKMPFRQNG